VDPGDGGGRLRAEDRDPRHEGGGSGEQSRARTPPPRARGQDEERRDDEEREVVREERERRDGRGRREATKSGLAAQREQDETQREKLKANIRARFRA
jgi:hypothetical protein